MPIFLQAGAGGGSNVVESVISDNKVSSNELLNEFNPHFNPRDQLLSPPGPWLLERMLRQPGMENGV